jgi:hypothetical protein
MILSSERKETDELLSTQKFSQLSDLAAAFFCKFEKTYAGLIWGANLSEDRLLDVRKMLTP